MLTVFKMRKIRKVAFKDLEKVIKAHNAVLEEMDKHEHGFLGSIVVAKQVVIRIEEYISYYNQVISIMNKQIEETDEEKLNTYGKWYIKKYKSLKEDTEAVLNGFKECKDSIQYHIKKVIDSEWMEIVKEDGFND